MTGTDESTRAARVTGAAVRVGDDLLYLGKPYRVLALDPYERPPGSPGTRIARSLDGWCMTLFPTQGVWVVRPTASGEAGR